MTTNDTSIQRTMGLFSATGVGIGAIVGGGILALAGVAFATTGPGALAAFAINGFIAFLTALSFAELSSSFPQSGGTYTFAKKVLSVEAAFAVGWVVWFASIVAAVLYSIGFASFFIVIVDIAWKSMAGASPEWFASRWTITGLSIGATLVYFVSLSRRGGGGGQWINVVKVTVFGILIGGGVIALFKADPAQAISNLKPFFPFGAMGLVQAMGYTFIALQGFDLIAAVAGEVKDPSKTIPRAMILSLSVALAIYLPLLFIVITVGMAPGQSLVQASSANQETIIAIAAEQILGKFGFWLVMVAGILSMLSALQANVFAASRVAFAMARDRTLPRFLDQLDTRHGTPGRAVAFTALLIILILLVIPDVASAGAASSLIFLVTFALAHMICYLARHRVGLKQGVFSTPFFPVIPLTGIIFCVSLALFQGVAEPTAGMIATIWLVLGGILFFVLFARRARVADAAAEARDPDLLKLRGRSPLVLVPIANPASAASLVTVANTITPPRVGKVLLLSVVKPPGDCLDDQIPRELTDAQAVLQKSLCTSFSKGLFPEALTTVADDPWSEIQRVARVYRCRSLLVGFSKLSEQISGGHLEELINNVESDVVIVRSPENWDIESVQRIVVPVGGKGDHDVLRARLLSSICREGAERRDIMYLTVIPERTPADVEQDLKKDVTKLAREEVPGNFRVHLVRSDSAIEPIANMVRNTDLLVLGIQQAAHKRRLFGNVTLSIIKATTCPVIMICRQK